MVHHMAAFRDHQVTALDVCSDAARRYIFSMPRISIRACSHISVPAPGASQEWQPGCGTMMGSSC